MPKGFVYEGETWQPLTYTLSDGPVNSIQTSNTDPKVGFDSTGFWITDSNGNKAIQLTTNGLVLPGGFTGPGQDVHAINWGTSGKVYDELITHISPPNPATVISRLHASVTGTDGTQDTLIIDSQGISDLIMGELAVIDGTTGNILWQMAGKLTCNRTGAGTYSVTNTDAPKANYIFGTIVNSAAESVRTGPLGVPPNANGTVTITTLSSAGAAVDAAFALLWAYTK